MASGDLLTTALAVSVSLWLHKVKHYSQGYRVARAHELGQLIAEHGDLILFKSKRRGETAKYFNNLAEAWPSVPTNQAASPSPVSTGASMVRAQAPSTDAGT